MVGRIQARPEATGLAVRAPVLVLVTLLLGRLGAGAQGLAWSEAERLDEPAGELRTTLNFGRGVAVGADGAVHAVFYRRASSADDDPVVHYRRRERAGWHASVVLSDDAGGEYPSIAVAGDRLFAVWQSGGEAGRIWLRDSRDGGATWSSPFAVSESGSVVHASVVVAGPVLHVVWVDSREGPAEVYHRRSLDTGGTWQPARRLSAPGHDSWTPSLAAEGDLVAVAWVDTRDGNEEEYVTVSADAGETWGGEARLTHDEMNSWAPSVAVADGVVHLVWFDQRDNEFHLSDAEAMLDQAMRLVGLEPEPAPEGILVPDPEQAGRMTFYSQAFQHRVQEKSRAIGEAVHPWVEAGGDPRRVARLMGEFNRRMWIASREWELYYARSDDAGLSWSRTERLTEAEGSSSRPNLVAHGGALHLVWFDDRHGESEIYYKSSPDAGRVWTEDARLTEAHGDSEQPMLALGPDGGVHVLWADERSGTSEIYYLAGAAVVTAP